MARESSSVAPAIQFRRVVRALELVGYAVIVTCYILYIPVACSPLWLKSCAAIPQCRRFLREGWLGPTFDGADDQWRELRESLPLLFATVAAHGLLSLLVRKTCSRTVVQVNSTSALDASDAAPRVVGASGSSPSLALPRIPMGELGRRRAMLNAAVSAVFMAVLHGAHAAFPLALVCGTFAVGHALKGTKFALPATWAMAVGLIWLKEKWYVGLTFENVVGEGFAWLDRFRGLHPWRLSFNLAVLRIVSFNVDLHWAELHRTKHASHKASFQTNVGIDEGDRQAKDAREQHGEADLHTYSSRVSAHRPNAEYSLWHFLCYTFYAPLYLAGPTMTFNAFVSHMACPQQSYGSARLAFYLARFVVALVLLEWAVHNLPVFALARSSSLNFKPEILALFVYAILLIMWLKFLVIWRLFRLWALCDGVEPPENMQKCMSNNYSVVGFWKGWHCSFNRWLVRYIFVPLGGSKPGRRWNVFVVFVFVAFWHDVERNLFMWGLLNGVFLVMEIVVKGLYGSSTALARCRSNPLVNRMIQAVGATLNVMALLLVNMIGYAAGIKGTSHVAAGLFFSREGQLTVAYSFLFLFSGVQLMFAIEEAREGKEKGKRHLHPPAYSHNKYKKIGTA